MSASYVVASELKCVKENMKKWNKEVFGDIKAQIIISLVLLVSFDVKEESCGLTGDKIHQRLLKMIGSRFLSWRKFLRDKI